MSKVKSSETKLEKIVREKFWSQGIRYRKNNSKYFGKPDLSIVNKQTMIFIDSCFWHGCKKHLRLPSTHEDYWKKKISKNIKRDRTINKYYTGKGWKIIRIWEHDLDNEILLKTIIKNLKQ